MDDAASPLDELLEHLKVERGFDFTGYKRTTLERRIQKRMATVAVDDYATYLDYLQVHPDEFAALFNTILINVTGLFRDPDAWDALQKQVLPALFARRGDEDPIRAWCAGCASGEEAYTIAIVVAEVLGKEATFRRLKVYATDVDDEALKQARRASFAVRDVEDVPPALVEKYFDRVGDRFELRKELRRCIIFGRHDLIHDAPISRIDLLTCRNTIMYLNAETQEHILRRMHFALNEGGILMLGKAEMLLTHGDLFTPVDLKQRIFTRDARGVPARDRTPLRVSASPATTASLVVGERLREAAFDASSVAQIVVNLDGVLALASQRAREVFGLTAQDVGRPLQDLEVSYRPVELRSIIEQCYAERRPIVLKEIERHRPGEPQYYDVQVAPIFDRGGMLVGAEVSFLDITHTVRLQQQLRRVNTDLEAAFEELQSTGEELETTNEELQSTVEELETTNEELQSTNEELETMNEELQSTNEELQTLNDELRQRGEDLGQTNLFLETILGSLRSAVIVLDRDLHVKVWNARAQELWGLRPDEVLGKSLVGLDIGLPVDKLTPTIRACFAGESMQEISVDAMNRRGRRLECRVICSRIEGDGEARGAVLMIGEMEGHAS